MSGGGVPNMRELQRALKDQDWTFETTSNGHYKALGPSGSIVTFCDSGEPRSMLNNLAELRRHGFQWPPPSKKGDGRKAPPSEADLEYVFTELKTARLALGKIELKHQATLDAVAQAKRVLAEAELAAATTQSEVDTARRRVMETKVLFDETFEGTT